MSCPPTHFRRSHTSPSVLKSAAARSPAEEERERVDLGRRITRNSPRDEAQDGAERGRKPAREELQRGRRSATAGPLGGSVVRARERGSRPRSGLANGGEQALERWTLSVDLDAMTGDSLEAERSSSSRDEDAPVDSVPLPFDLAAASPSLTAPPFPSFSPPIPPPPYHARPGSSPRRSTAHPSAPRPTSLVRSFDLPSRRPFASVAPYPLDTAIATFDADWSPIFSPEHCTALHVSLHGAGGGALPSPSTSSSATLTQPRRLSYDVPDECDAWEAAMRCLGDGEAHLDEAREEGKGRGASAAGGRTAAARRRLEMVRVQLAG